MRLLPSLAACCLAAAAQPQANFTLDQVLGSAFPTELTAAPSGAKVAWVSNLRGSRSILVVEKKGPAVTIAHYPDDGREISELRWTPDGSAIVYTLGGEPDRTGETPNPALDTKGVERAVWIAHLSGGAPVRLGGGSQPDVSPRSDRVVFAFHDRLWWAPLDGRTPATQVFQGRGNEQRPKWSPDGSRISFVSQRGDHSLIGVYDVGSATLRYLDPGTDFDAEPAWSPDGRSIAFIRIPSNGLRPVRGPERAGEPWSIRVASVETGAGREIWRAKEGPGSVFREVTAANQLLWAAGGRIVFPWEGDGWTHLYSVSVEGGPAIALTPGEFEVEDVAPAPGGQEVYFSSNQNDIDRRHLWKVAAAGGSPEEITQGEGIEVSPTPTSETGVIAWLAADGRTPMHPVLRYGGTERKVDPRAAPEGFPLASMVTPRQVIFSSADGLPIHGQLFLPPGRSAERSPAVVFFHGGSRRQMLLGWHYMYYYSNAYAMNQYLANHGYVVLSVNYRSGIGYGLNFREALDYGPAGGSEYNDVQGAGVYLRSRADVDPNRIAAWGGSYGGYLTAMALARASDLYKCGVDFHGVHDWAKELEIPVTAPDYKIAFESSPMNFLDTWRSPVLLMQGDDDPDVHFNQTVMLADALRRHGVEMKEIVFPDEVHDFLLYRTWLAAYQATVQFLDGHLKR